MHISGPLHFKPMLFEGQLCEGLPHCSPLISMGVVCQLHSISHHPPCPSPFQGSPAPHSGARPTWPLRTVLVMAPQLCTEHWSFHCHVVSAPASCLPTVECTSHRNRPAVSPGCSVAPGWANESFRQVHRGVRLARAGKAPVHGGPRQGCSCPVQKS